MLILSRMASDGKPVIEYNTFEMEMPRVDLYTDSTAKVFTRELRGGLIGNQNVIIDSRHSRLIGSLLAEQKEYE